MAATKRNNRKSEAAEAVKGVTAVDVINQIGNLQVDLQKTLANLSADITNKLDQMNQVDMAIAEKREELKELYEIDATASSIEEVLARKAETEANWAKAQADRQAKWNEENTLRTKTWQRESEEHAYNTKVQQLRIKDEFETEVARLKREEEVRQESLSKLWRDRDESLKAREKEVDELRAKVASFDDRVKAEVAKEVAIATNSQKKHYETQIQLINKDMTTEKQIYQSKIEALNETIAVNLGQIKDLQVQLNAARMDAKEVTSAALSSASGRQVAEALQKVVDNNSTGSSKSK